MELSTLKVNKKDRVAYITLSRPGLITNKRALREAAKRPSFGPGTRVGVSYTTQYMGSAEEPREGIQAFLEKRKTVFK